MKSWKTTVCGLAAVALTGLQTTPGFPPWAAHLCGVLVPVATGLGLMFARDFDKSSEDHGIEKP